MKTRIVFTLLVAVFATLAHAQDAGENSNEAPPAVSQGRAPQYNGGIVDFSYATDGAVAPPTQVQVLPTPMVVYERSAPPPPVAPPPPPPPTQQLPPPLPTGPQPGFCSPVRLPNSPGYFQVLITPNGSQPYVLPGPQWIGLNPNALIQAAGRSGLCLRRR